MGYCGAVTLLDEDFCHFSRTRWRASLKPTRQLVDRHEVRGIDCLGFSLEIADCACDSASLGREASKVPTSRVIGRILLRFLMTTMRGRFALRSGRSTWAQRFVCPLLRRDGIMAGNSESAAPFRNLLAAGLRPPKPRLLLPSA